MSEFSLLAPEGKITLETLVAKVDYTTMFENYMPSDYAFRVINTSKLIYGDKGIENKTPLIHFHMLDQIECSINTLNIAARGTAKTTNNMHIVFDAAIYGNIPNFGDISVAMYVSDTSENGVKTFFTNLKYTWENSLYLRQWIPKARFTQEEAELINKDGHKFFIRGFGVNTGVRGFLRYNKRPELAIFDDLFTDKNAQSPTVVKDIENIIYNAVEQALHPTRRKIIWTGTPFNKKDPLYKAAGNGAWHVSVYPICNKFPCRKEEFVGAWEDRFTYEAVLATYTKLKKAGKEDGFAQELMLRIMSDEDRLVQASDLVWYNRDKVLANLNYYNIYITTDFAVSEKEGADFSGVFVWAFNSNEDWMLIDGYLERLDMAENFKRLFEYVQAYPQVIEVGIEVSGQQKGFISLIKNEMVKKSMYFTLATDTKSGEEGFRPTTDKLARFNSILPKFRLKKMWFPKELEETEFMLELVDELTNITKGGIKAAHDDGIDCVSMLSQFKTWKPSSAPIEHVEHTVYDEYHPWELPSNGRSSYIV